MRRRSWAPALIGACTLTTAAAASPGTSAGFGSRERALAGASVAAADGAASVFENPAGLVESRDPELSFGFAWTGYDLAIDGVDAALSSVPELTFGTVIPGSVLTVPVAFGLALSLPDGRYSKLRNADPEVVYFPLDDSGPRLLDLGMGLAVEPSEWLALGGGIGFLAAARGGFQVRGTAVSADGSGSEYESDLRHAVEADLVTVRYPILGATLTPLRELAIGLAYRGSATIEQRLFGALDGALRINTVEIPVSYAFSTRAALAFVPAKLALGAAARPLTALLASVELDWEVWSAYPRPYAHGSARLDAEPPPELPPGLVPMLPPPEPAPPVELSDRLVPKLGVEYRFELTRSLDMLARAGYAFQAAVVPERQPETLLADFDRHVFALGAGARWGRPVAPFAELGLDVHASYTQGVARSTTSGPSADPTRHELTGRLFGAGAGLRMSFDARGPSRTARGGPDE